MTNDKLKYIIAELVYNQLNKVLTINEILSCIRENDDIVKYGNYSINCYRLKALFNSKMLE